MPNDDQANKEARRYLESHLSDEALTSYNEALECLKESMEPMGEVIGPKETKDEEGNEG